MTIYSFSSIGLLIICLATALLVTVASGAYSYRGNGARARGLLASTVSGESGSLFGNRYDRTDAAARAMQVESCAVSGAHEVCHTAKLESGFPVHVCPKDGSACNPDLCYYSSVPPCCSGNTAALECHSVTTLLIEGKTVNVTHYRIPLAAGQVCISVNPAIDICDEQCSIRCTGIECVQNVECDSNGANCQCREGFTEESECCNCAENYYRDNTTMSCIGFCRDNCRQFRPPNGDGCLTCQEGYIDAPECCECDTAGNATHAFYRTSFGCILFCKSNCAVIGSSGCDTCKTGYVSEPECCECDTAGNATHAFYRTSSGECKPFCKNNCAVIGSSGCDTCKTGYVSEPECCGCDTAGNATHAFYRTSSGECKPFCKSNCAVIGSSGCDSCKSGFMAEPECCQCESGRREVNGICKCISNLNADGSCIPEARSDDCCECITGYQKNATTGKCEPERCDKQQNLFFYIDATASNIYKINFCPLMVVMQMLVAAFNPSSTSGTQIASVLFSDNAKNKGPSMVIDVGTSCFDAVQGSDKSLKSLIIDFGVCVDNGRLYDSSLFPSSCGEGTSAVKGLQEIYNIASRSRNSTEGAIVMLTDGVIIDDASERTKVLNTLKTAGISTLIAAGINEANVENLKLYTSDNNILVGNDSVQLGIDIVNKMEERGIVCKDHADNITRSLREAQGSDLLNNFCVCHRKKYIGQDVCQRKYPTCGGSLSIGLPNSNQPGRTKIQELEDLEYRYVNQMLLEEEILAAVEKVLDQRG